MSIRMKIAIMLFLMVQAVVFGIGVVLVLATPLAGLAMTLMPWVVILSVMISTPISWYLVPMARSKYARQLNRIEPGRSLEV